jgi:hypothetical protein
MREHRKLVCQQDGTEGALLAVVGFLEVVQKEKFLIFSLHREDDGIDFS